MKFTPYHYKYIDELIRYYASSLSQPKITSILDNGIQSEDDAKEFCNFIPTLLDQRFDDEKSEKNIPVDIGTGIIPDLHYEAGSFVCDAGYESIWDSMIDKL